MYLAEFEAAWAEFDSMAEHRGGVMLELQSGQSLWLK